MTRQRLLVIGLLLGGLVLIVALVAIPRFGAARTLTGYVEGEPLYLAAPVAGTVTTMSVVRGEEVKAGQPLFVVDPRQLTAARDQALANLAAARAQALDARKGQRPQELAVQDANIAAAEARAHNAEIQLKRMVELVAAGNRAQSDLDNARAEAEADEAALAAARRQRAAQTLGQRPDLIAAADARVRDAQAALAGAIAHLADNAPKAPEAAQVEDVFFQQGEWASANQPILALLPASRVYVRFFVPEGELAAYRPGEVVRFGCDGCRKGLTARITYVSPRPEFTPPVIFSRETRDRLVFLVEARPSARLTPGLPVDVEPLERAR